MVVAPTCAGLLPKLHGQIGALPGVLDEALEVEEEEMAELDVEDGPAGEVEAVEDELAAEAARLAEE